MRYNHVSSPFMCIRVNDCTLELDDETIAECNRIKRKDCINKWANICCMICVYILVVIIVCMLGAVIWLAYTD